jgi:hypothetical protein
MVMAFARYFMFGVGAGQHVSCCTKPKSPGQQLIAATRLNPTFWHCFCAFQSGFNVKTFRPVVFVTPPDVPHGIIEESPGATKGLPQFR